MSTRFPLIVTISGIKSSFYARPNFSLLFFRGNTCFLGESFSTQQEFITL